MAVKTIINQGREKSCFGSRLRAPLAFLMKLLVPPANPLPYDRARAAFAYKGSGAALVKRKKFGDRPELAQILARLIYSRTGDVLPRHAFLVPVPLHRRRLVWRRFNQSAEICRHLAALILKFRDLLWMLFNIMKSSNSAAPSHLFQPILKIRNRAPNLRWMNSLGLRLTNRVMDNRHQV